MMNRVTKRFSCLLGAALWSLVSGLPVVADDTELFVSRFEHIQSNAQGNILLVLDSSASMQVEIETQEAYDPARAYNGACSTSRVYWRQDVGDPPTCDMDRWVERSAFVCNAALNAFALGTGFYTDLMAQYDPDNEAWVRLNENSHNFPVECEDDSGIHGESGARVYAQNNDDRNLWSDDTLDEVSWGQNPTDRTYTFFDGNYLNWYYGPLSVATRMDIMQDVATDVLNTIDNVNVGVMRFKREEGGIVLHAIEDIATARSRVTHVINSLQPRDATTLSETLYEAGQYYAGRLVDYGDLGDGLRSVSESRVPANSALYQSPIELGCQKNHILLLTDGIPSIKDDTSEPRITALPGFTELLGPSCDGTGRGVCLDDMAEYLFKADLSDLPGKQNVITHAIGFTVDDPLIATTAERGGGAYYTANDTASLSVALTSIVSSVVSNQNSFTAPTILVDSFNRTQTLNEIYLSVFEPSVNVHWPGNLKKYRIRASDGAILDANGVLAIDTATGRFSENSRSLWSGQTDGGQVSDGGAADQLPEPALRQLLTYLGESSLVSPSNEISRSNARINAEVLGIGNPGDPSRNELIDFIRGVDVTDTDQDGNASEPRQQIGDPLHSSPVSVIYGGSTANPDVNDAIVFFSTNDGYLHAIDPETGVEKWAFIPPEFLSDQLLIYRNDPVETKHYGLDGNLQVQMLADRNGVIEPELGEKVYLFFGMRRGGAVYYALDVTVPETPRLLWRSDSADLPSLGQSWSTPIPTRLNIQGANQNTEKLVLIFGGGYDPSQDNDAASMDSSGNAIYIVDSVSGELLWHASADGADLDLSEMLYSFPSDMKVLDLNGDMFADRIYAADMGGQVWRFDVFNGEPVNNLVNGGVIAQLGGAPLDDPSIADNRRFYYSPDVALVNDDNNSFFHIGIGSGHRAHPNGTGNHDRFFALRDYNAFSARTQADYDASTPTRDDDLVNITDDLLTTVPIGSPGWKLELRDGGWRGEKVLAEARTFNNQIIFTTFTPASPASVNDCEPSPGTNRVYVLDLFNGAPVNNLDGLGDNDELTTTDRFEEFDGSIASEAILIFPSPEDPNCVGDQCTPPPLACVDLFCFPVGFTNEPVRTFWSQDTAR